VGREERWQRDDFALLEFLKENLMNPTPAQVKAALSLLVAVAETIRELKEVPAGTLYISLLSHFPNLTATQFAQLTDKLKEAKLITETSHLIRWIGPSF
jgi:hypothetical protein